MKESGRISLRWQGPIEAEVKFEFTHRQRLFRPVTTGEFEEQKAFREAEILLQDPVAGVDVVRIGQQRIVALEANRFKRTGLLAKALSVDLELDMGKLVGEPEIEFIGGVAVTTEVQAQLVQLQLAERQRGMQGDVQRDGGEIVAALGRDMTNIRRVDPGIVTGTEMTGHLVQRQTVELASLLDQRRLGNGARNDRKLHDGHAGHGTQIVGPEHIEQTMGQLGKLILYLGAQIAGEKREAFQQALHIWIGILLRQKAGELGMAICKFAPLQAQKCQLIPEVMFQRH